MSAWTEYNPTQLERMWLRAFYEVGLKVKPVLVKKDGKTAPFLKLLNVRHRSYTDEHEPIYVAVRETLTEAEIEEFSKLEIPVMVISDIPKQDKYGWIDKRRYEWTYDFIDGDAEYPAYLSMHRGEIWIAGPDHDEYDGGKLMIKLVATAVKVKNMMMVKEHDKPKSLYLYDIIQLTFYDAIRIRQNTWAKLERSPERLKKPALEEFVVYDAELECYFIYKKAKINYTDGKIGFIPYVDVLLVSKIDDGIQKLLLTIGEYENEVVLRPAINADDIKTTEEGLHQISTQLEMYYFLIQAILYERPEIFVKTIEKMPFNERSHGNRTQRSERKRVVRMVKVLRINHAEVQNIVKEHREITCPCWGVIGHWREYKKSGKRVWIQPYRKGKKRNDPNAYSAKEYRVEV